MGWATPYIAKLKNGETVFFRPRGHSMKGKIESGQLCTVEPIKEFESLQKGDIVLCSARCGSTHSGYLVWFPILGWRRTP